MHTLSLDRLSLGFPGISPRFGTFLAEATAVCLHTAGHKSGAKWTISGELNQELTLTWDQEISEQVLNTWLDRDEATEYGATGMALLFLLVQGTYAVTARSVKGTGFDYWLGPATEETTSLKPSARLEISGIRDGDKPKILKRVYKKLKQVNQSSHLQLPALIVVSEFRQLLTYYVNA